MKRAFDFLQRVRLGIVPSLVLLGLLAAAPLCVWAYVTYRSELQQLRSDALADRERETTFAAEFVAWRVQAMATRLVRARGAPVDDSATLQLSQLQRAPGDDVVSTAIVSNGGSQQDPLAVKVSLADLLRRPAGAAPLPAAYLLDEQQNAYAFGGPQGWPGRLVVRPPTGTAIEVFGNGLPATAQDGPRVLGSWRVALAPADTPDSPRELALRRNFLAGGSFALLLGAGLVLFAARRIRRQFENVVSDFGETEGNSVISEFAQIGEVLADARAMAGRTAQELQRARHDLLTGLPGRELFVERAQAQPRVRGYGMAVLYIDLDGFKQLNDSMGHAFGDEVLKEVATALRRSVREGDSVARWGGDEFVVCCPAPLTQLTEVANAAAHRISHEISGIRAGLGCSIGWAVGLGDSDLQDLMQRADTAMYEAKTAKRA